MTSGIIKYALIYKTELAMEVFNGHKLMCGRIGNLHTFKLQYTLGLKS